MTYYLKLFPPSTAIDDSFMRFIIRCVNHSTEKHPPHGSFEYHKSAEHYCFIIEFV